MRQHILKSLRCHGRRDILSPPVAFRLRQVYIEIPRHQQSGAPGALLERDDDTLYCQGVVGGKVTSHDVPPPLPRRQLEADDVGPKLLDGLHHKMRCRPVKHCHSAALSDWHVRCDDAIPSQTVGADSICYLCLMEDAQVHVGLGHIPQCRLWSPVTAVTDVVGAEPNRCLPPRRTPSTLTHPPPTDAFLTPDPAALPARACLPFRRSRSRSAPPAFHCRFCLRSRPRSPPFPTPCHSPRNGVLRSALTQGK